MAEYVRDFFASLLGLGCGMAAVWVIDSLRTADGLLQVLGIVSAAIWLLLMVMAVCCVITGSRAERGRYEGNDQG